MATVMCLLASDFDDAVFDGAGVELPPELPPEVLDEQAASMTAARDSRSPARRDRVLAVLLILCI
jgi:hypothetical protein